MSDGSLWIESLTDDLLGHVAAAAAADLRSAEANLASAQDEMDRVVTYAAQIDRERAKRQIQRERAS